MDELLIADINANMALGETSFKKYQITDIELMFGNVFAGFCQIFSGSRQFHAKCITKCHLNKTRTINASFVQASQFIRCTFPAAVLFIQALVD